MQHVEPRNRIDIDAQHPQQKVKHLSASVYIKMLTIRIVGRNLPALPTRRTSQCLRRRYCVAIADTHRLGDSYTPGLITQARVLLHNTMPLLPKNTHTLIANNMEDPPIHQLTDFVVMAASYPTILPGYTVRGAAAWLRAKHEPGFIYALQQPDHDAVKLGQSKNLQRRLREHRWASQCSARCALMYLPKQVLLSRWRDHGTVASPQRCVRREVDAPSAPCTQGPRGRGTPPLLQPSPTNAAWGAHREVEAPLRCQYNTTGTLCAATWASCTGYGRDPRHSAAQHYHDGRFEA